MNPAAFENLTVMLPFPPGANNLFVNNPRGGRFPSAQYKKWKELATLALMQQPRWFFTVPVEVKYSFGRPDKRRRDVFNLEKAVSDALVQNRILSDDSLIQRGTVEWDSSIIGVKILITPLDDYL